MRMSKGREEVSSLPPPPAPPARDANPWPLPDRKAPASGTAPTSPRQWWKHAAGVDSRQRTASRVSLAVGLVLLAAGIVLARVLGGEDIGDVAGAMFPLVILVILLATRRARRRGRERADRRSNS